MYKQKNKSHLEKSEHIAHWLKRKFILIITAFMIGMSNAVYEEDKKPNENQYRIEQKDKKD
ncbi:hypothetical protein [Tenacibaculum sp. MAR_2009_124]|uniref:hypothetical protein n=1 Tax=Tenacibaculum sp. MAR_2009_124 TaxID=1250059 RepID=UPI000B87AD7E|nr:hypothetical protein [Tenacibaculum sp. MAR_2009_124]